MFNLLFTINIGMYKKGVSREKTCYKDMYRHIIQIGIYIMNYLIIIQF